MVSIVVNVMLWFLNIPFVGGDVGNGFGDNEVVFLVIFVDGYDCVSYRSNGGSCSYQ